MRILFCNIAWMSYYKGNIDGKDEPHGGGSYVQKNKQAHEDYNFEAVELQFEDNSMPDGEYCLGFVETKSTNGVDNNQMAIEKISGCEACRNESQVEEVLVVYCARYPFSDKRETIVVGWYKHATVYRYYELQEFSGDKGEIYVQSYNAIAKKEDCVLLPTGVRRRGNTWKVTRMNDKLATFGFGQSNVWFANEKNNEKLQEFLNRLVKQIDTYDGENRIDKYPTL